MRERLPFCFDPLLLRRTSTLGGSRGGLLFLLLGRLSLEDLDIRGTPLAGIVLLGSDSHLGSDREGLGNGICPIRCGDIAVITDPGTGHVDAPQSVIVSFDIDPRLGGVRPVHYGASK
jgi:hypothetical protein